MYFRYQESMKHMPFQGYFHFGPMLLRLLYIHNKVDEAYSLFSRQVIYLLPFPFIGTGTSHYCMVGLCLWMITLSPPHTAAFPFYQYWYITLLYGGGVFMKDHLKPSSHCCLSLLLVLVHHITVWWRCVNERSPLALLTLLPFPFIGTGTSHYCMVGVCL